MEFEDGYEMTDGGECVEGDERPRAAPDLLGREPPGGEVRIEVLFASGPP